MQGCGAESPRQEPLGSFTVMVTQAAVYLFAV
jgi:hypothetical protein